MWYALFFGGCFLAMIGLAGMAITERPQPVQQSPWAANWITLKYGTTVNKCIDVDGMTWPARADGMCYLKDRPK